MMQWSCPAAAAVAQLVAAQPMTSFPDVVDYFDAVGLTSSGDVVICEGRDPNVVLWLGVSELLSAAVREVLDAGAAHLVPVPVVVAMWNGGAVRFPIARGPRPAGGYRSPHWAPAMIRQGPPPERRVPEPGRPALLRT